jgi:uncharacterized protein
MKAFKAGSVNKGEIGEELIVGDVIEAGSFFSKLSGLVFRRKLRHGQGFLIKNCKSIHTIGMRYSIDVIFLDKRNKVMAIYCNIRPFRITPFVKDAYSVLEVSAGTIDGTSLKVTDFMRFF